MSKYQHYGVHPENPANPAGRTDPRGARGTYGQEITDHTQQLDAFARIFSEIPYTAIIESRNNSDDLYISFPEHSVNDNNNSMAQPEVQNLRNDLQAVLNARNGNADELIRRKKQLLLRACDADNEILKSIIRNELTENSDAYSDRDIGYLNELVDRHHNLQDFTGHGISTERRNFINRFVQEHFDDFLNEEELNCIQNLNVSAKTLRIVPYQNNYNGVHVEAKGVHYITTHIPAQGQEFYTGLAKSDGNRQVGCCACCCLEFNILETRRPDEQKIIVHRTADYPENAPPGLYNPSPNIHGNEREFFRRAIIQQNSQPGQLIGLPIGAVRYYIQEERRLNDEVINLTQTRDNLQQANQGLQDQLSDIQQQNTELSTQIKERDSIIEHERAHKEKLQTKLTETENDLNTQIENNTILSKEFTEEKQKFHTQIKELDSTVEQERTNKEKLQTKLTETENNLNTQIEKNTILSKEFTEEKQKFHTQIKELDSTVEHERVNKEKLQTKLTETENNLNAQVEKNTILSKEFTEEKQKFHTQIKEQDNIIEQQRENNTQLQTKLTEVNKNNIENCFTESLVTQLLNRSDFDISELIYNLQQKQSSLITQTQTQEQQLSEPEATEPPSKKFKSDDEHLKRSEKEKLINILLQEEREENGKYNLTERFAAVNDNQELLNKLDREAVITANINFKAIDAKKSAETEKTGSVEIRPEHNHLTDHNNNNKALIAEIQAGTIDKNTVIAIERKQYGENLGMKDVIKIANILEHNEKNPDNPLKLPEELENTPIFQDALLYKVAKEKGIKVISLEGRNLEHTKGSALYKENREQYMTEVISEVRSKGYNIVASVGSSHVANLENALEITKQNNNIIGFDKIPRKLQKEESIIDKQTETGTSIEILPKEIKQTALNIGNSISQQIDSNPSVKQTKPSKTWVEQLTESSKINKNSVGREA